MPGLLPFLLVLLATARLTKIVVSDKIGMPFRNWVVSKSGEQGWFTFLVHCPWCAGFWIAAGVAPLWWFFGTTPYFIIPCLALALSYATGLLSQLEQG